jgi:hypothetical protein
MPANWDVLIPELKDWNNGKGIDPEAWIGCQGSFQLAIGYSLIFWPKFIEHKDLVLRTSDTLFQYNLEKVDQYILNRGKNGCEALYNHLHIAHIQSGGCPDTSTERIIYLGNILKEIYTTKLKQQFSERDFKIKFYEPEDKQPSEYQLIFYQSKYAHQG